MNPANQLGSGTLLTTTHICSLKESKLGNASVKDFERPLFIKAFKATIFF